MRGTPALLLAAALGALGCRPGTGASAASDPAPPPAAKGTGPPASAWKFKPGDRFSYEVTRKAKESVKAFGQERSSENETTLALDFAVREATPAGAAVLDVTVSSVKTANPADRVLEKLAGGKLVVTLGPALEIAKLDGIDVVADRVAGREPADESTTRILRGTYDAFFRLWLQEVFPSVPAAAVDKDHAWDRETRQDSPIGRVEFKKTYTSEGVAHGDPGAIKVAVSGTSKIEPPEKQEGLPFRIDKAAVTKEKLTGLITFDPAVGRLVRAETRHVYDMEMTGTVQGRTSDGVTHSDVTMVVRLLGPGTAPKK